MTERHAQPPSVARAPIDYGYIAFLVLRGAFMALPILVGVDKYFDWMVDWRQYLWSGIPDTLHISPTSFMHVAGALEIVAGLVVLFAPQIGGALVAGWITGIVANLVLVGLHEHEYWDIALRDFGLLLGAIALTALATQYRPTIRPTGSGG